MTGGTFGCRYPESGCRITLEKVLEEIGMLALLSGQIFKVCYLQGLSVVSSPSLKESNLKVLFVVTYR